MERFILAQAAALPLMSEPGGLVASLPNIEVSTVAGSARPRVEAVDSYAGLSTAPNPSPPRFAILT